jgi:hypothetical protein
MADDAWQRQRDTKLALVAADRDCRALITQHDFRDPRRHDAVAIDCGVLVEQPEPPLRIVAVGGAAGLFVDSRRDQNHAGPGKRVIISVLDIDRRRKRSAVTDVGRDRFRRVRLTSTISRALPRVTAASAIAQPTLPVPMMPSFMRQALNGLPNRCVTKRAPAGP